MAGITGATRTVTKLLIDNVTLNSTKSTYTSGSFSTDFYRNFILYIKVMSTGSPTDIVFDVEFSHDNVLWYKYTNWFYGDLRYEDLATESPGVYESVSFPCAGRYMRVKITGTVGQASFNTTVYAEFYT
jgi:hypothetical protein